MRLITELSPDELADYSVKGLALCGFKRNIVRLLCRCLELQPSHPRGLMSAGLFLSHLAPVRPLAAAALEYLSSPAFSLDAQTRTELERTQLRLKWTWGFARHETGERHLKGDKFEDPSQFGIDDERYWQFLSPVVAQAGSLQACTAAGVRLLALMCGALHHPTFRLKDLGQGIPSIIFEKRGFTKPEEYALWLRNNDTGALDEILESMPEGQNHDANTDGSERNAQAVRRALRPGERIVRAPRTRTEKNIDGFGVTMGAKAILLDDVASFIWSQIESPKTEQQLVVAIVNAYDVDEPTASTDLCDFLRDLMDRGFAHRMTVAPKGRWGWLTAPLRGWKKLD